jgi:nitrile hydratase beta subunit
MNGIHDMGGMDNFGPIITEENEPVFHEDWERAVFANTLALLGTGYFCVDEMRRSTERIPPIQYLASSYYENWLESLINILREKNVITAEELQEGESLRTNGTALPPLPKEGAEFITSNPLPTLQELEQPPLFQVGDKVTAKVIHPAHHTRLPRYIRGKQGTVEKINGAFLLPDSNAHGDAENPQHNYSVRFSARELWGSDAPPKDCLFIDLFESYMEHL